MATTNDITGDKLISRESNENYRNNYDLIFGKKKKEEGKEDGDNRLDETVQEQEAS